MNTNSQTGIFHWFGYLLPPAERIALLKAAGFSTVMLWWGDEFREIDGPKEDLAAQYRKAGQEIANGHVPYGSANDLWRDNLDGQALYERYDQCVRTAAENGLGCLVVHPIEGKGPPPIHTVGIQRLRRLADLAGEKGVGLAMENLAPTGHLDEIFAAIPQKSLGFCYDSGHDMAFSIRPYEVLEKYGDRLFALHLHDNDGSGDQHFLPGQGKVDWSRVGGLLLTAAYSGPYTLECMYPYQEGKPAALSPEEYLHAARQSLGDTLGV